MKRTRTLEDASVGSPVDAEMSLKAALCLYRVRHSVVPVIRPNKGNLALDSKNASPLAPELPGYWSRSARQPYSENAEFSRRKGTENEDAT